MVAQMATATSTAVSTVVLTGCLFDQDMAQCDSSYFRISWTRAKQYSRYRFSTNVNMTESPLVYRSEPRLGLFPDDFVTPEEWCWCLGCQRYRASLLSRCAAQSARIHATVAPNPSSPLTANKDIRTGADPSKLETFMTTSTGSRAVLSVCARPNRRVHLLTD
jgi:hypothetical protein